MAITIKDVAKEAGVSTATVSKVIHNKPSISEATRKHVYEVMKTLNYLPNAQASNLARKCSNNIIFLTLTETNSAFHNPHMFEIMSGAQQIIHSQKYNFSFHGVPDLDFAYHEAMDIITRKTADGILVHGSATSKALVNLFVESDFPHVLIGRPPFATPACWIDINNRVSGQVATNYLGECGYTKIAFIGGPETDAISNLRLQGFLSTMQINGLSVPNNLIKHGTYSKAGGFCMMEEILNSNCIPDAVICESNQIALGVSCAIEKHGLSVPEDIGLITFDNYPLSQLIEPALTVVDIDVWEMGQQAATILLQKIKKPALQIQSYTTLPRLIIRSSTINHRKNK